MSLIEKSRRPYVLIFDLDGVIVDTKRAVIEAYKIAGVDMPPEMWGHPWREWCDERTHNLKNTAYNYTLNKYAVHGPLFGVVRSLGSDAYVLTGASRDAAVLVRSMFHLNFRLLSCECSYTSKAATLMSLAFDKEIVYFDDDADVVNRLKVEVPTITTVLVK